jgi:hypothetical protein
MSVVESRARLDVYGVRIGHVGALERGGPRQNYSECSSWENITYLSMPDHTCPVQRK